MGTPGKRPFWMHQAAEYLIGVVFVAQGLQSPTPAIPSILGGLVVLNVACAKAPLAAFRVFGRRMHRLLDVVILGLIAVATVQPWIAIEPSTRLIMAMLGLVLGFIWWQSDFTQPVPKPARTAVAGPGVDPIDPQSASATPTTKPRQPDGTLPDTIGRTAGRLAGKGVNAYRAKRDQLNK